MSIASSTAAVHTSQPRLSRQATPRRPGSGLCPPSPSHKDRFLGGGGWKHTIAFRPTRVGERGRVETSNFQYPVTKGRSFLATSAKTTQNQCINPKNSVPPSALGGYFWLGSGDESHSGTPKKKVSQPPPGGGVGHTLPPCLITAYFAKICLKTREWLRQGGKTSLKRNPFVRKEKKIPIFVVHCLTFKHLDKKANNISPNKESQVSKPLNFLRSFSQNTHTNQASPSR